MAVYDAKNKTTTDNHRILGYLINSLHMLQHRGRAYWKIIVGNKAFGKEGSLPSNTLLTQIINDQKLNQKDESSSSALGYLSKRRPQFPSLNKVNIAFDGFLVDTDKLYLHPLIGNAKELDSLYKIYHIYTHLLIERENPEKAIEFLDRHLRGNLIIKINSDIYAYRNSSGFKPLNMATNRDKDIFIISSENTLRIVLENFNFTDIEPGEMLAITNKKEQPEIIENISSGRIQIDPFEFIRESHVASTFNGNSIYQIRKNIGICQANYLSSLINIDSAFAEPDYTRPMTLGFSQEYKNGKINFEISEGIIKDRYDDFDPMIDYSEQDSKNKLLTTGISLKFIIKNLIGKDIATVQGTIQTGSTAKETLYYLKKAQARHVTMIVSYVPTVDGRQVGLYTHYRDLLANKYIGKVSTIDEINENVSKELSVDKLYYNSPSLLAKGIGISEGKLWFPEWIRFLEYKR